MKTLYLLIAVASLIGCSSNRYLEQKHPSGIINFQGVDRDRVLAFYAQVADVKLKISPEVQQLASMRIYLQCRNLTRSELLQPLEQVLHDQGGVDIKHIDANHVEVIVATKSKNN